MALFRALNTITLSWLICKKDPEHATKLLLQDYFIFRMQHIFVFCKSTLHVNEVILLDRGRHKTGYWDDG